MTRLAALGLTLPILAFTCASVVSAQQIRGRVSDSANGGPVALAGVFLLDSERDVVVGSSSNREGFYVIEVPGAGEYYLYVQRLGYFENESPLVAVGPSGQYGIDIEMRPEPFRLDPLEVTVRNEELEDFLTLKLGRNPNSIFGYRVIQGVRLQEARLKAVDNTDLLRWLYIPVSHGVEVCIGSIGHGGRRPIPWGLSTEDRSKAAELVKRQCGALYVDDHRWQNEHVEEIDMATIGVVVVLGGDVHLYTRHFDWTMRPGADGT